MRFVRAILVVYCIAASVAAAAAAAEHGLLAEVWLDTSGHYVAQLHIGTPPQPKLLLLDIAQNSISVQCDEAPNSDATLPFVPPSSTTFRTVIRGGSPVFVDFPIAKQMQLVADSFTFNATDGINPGQHDVEVKGMKFFCASPSPQQPTGVAGLGRGKLALPSALAIHQKLPRRFAYCLSGNAQTRTPLFLGSSNYTFLPGLQFMSNLQHTPLLKPTKKRTGYRVGLFSVKVGDTTLSIHPKVFRGGLEVSTTEPYTKLVRPAYVALVDAFRRAESGIRRVPARAPFETCYNATGLGSTRVGPPVNVISFVFGDKKGTGAAEWPMYGASSMVFVSEDVMCLGFLDAGPLPAAHSVLGTYQQQESLVELDLEHNQLAFFATLMFVRTSCGNFNFTQGNFF
ncbi:hypothetical protein GOP47_0003313 [Adiantum capillus-veneris]|uniref:Peptidase A1 domain-containing protein n=1 Tax=Adiantum capillus-veneris TaxID=13818 RepID=A0A9D4VCK7_ADICA|nr:hypothetical protein GOP47_0003313 [Adiantum capillus-veneris]